MWVLTFPFTRERLREEKRTRKEGGRGGVVREIPTLLNA